MRRKGKKKMNYKHENSKKKTMILKIQNGIKVAKTNFCAVDFQLVIF